MTHSSRHVGYARARHRFRKSQNHSIDGRDYGASSSIDAASNKGADGSVEFVERSVEDFL